MSKGMILESLIPRLSRGILLFDNSLKQQTSLSEPLKAEQGGFL